MCDRITVPDFSQHAHADNASHVPPWGMQWPIQLLGQLFKSMGTDGPPQPIQRPIALAYGIEGETHPGRLVALGLPGVGLVHDLRIHANGVIASVLVAQPIQVGRWDSRGRFVLRKPLIDDVGDFRILADQNEHRRAPIGVVPFPFPPQ